MISFFITTNRLGNIKEVKWSDPPYLIPSVNRSFVDLISELDRPFLMETMEACSGEGYLNCDLAVQLSGHPYKVKLCTREFEDDILILGIESDHFDQMKRYPEIRELITHLVDEIVESERETANLNKETVRIQFEKIQSLNNELVNTKRMLEKANASLSMVNADLNNRLVKDPLTGLISRYQYRSEIEMAIASTPLKKGIFTFLDMDDFKGINDIYGHGVGDQYLVGFAERLRRFTLQNTLKIRIAGDEFALFIYGLEKVDDSVIEQIWIQIQRHVLSKPLQVDGMELPYSISAWMAVYDKDTTDIYDLIDYDDFAMYQAKRRGKNQYQVFDAAEYARVKQGQK